MCLRNGFSIGLFTLYCKVLPETRAFQQPARGLIAAVSIVFVDQRADNSEPVSRGVELGSESSVFRFGDRCLHCLVAFLKNFIAARLHESAYALRAQGIPWQRPP